MPENQSAENQNKPGEGGQQSTGDTPAGGEDQGKFKLTQEEFNRQLDERVMRERSKYVDYDDLKTKAARFDELEAANKSELDRATDALKSVESERDQARSEALRFKVASKHGITDEDAELFLTGTDEDTLTRQAQRLTETRSDSSHKPGPRPDLSQGSKGDGNSPSTAQQFADAIGDSLKF